MKCLHPITIRAPEGSGIHAGYHYILVPCGKCPVCLRKRQQDWSIRIQNEAEYTEKHGGAVYFITLTYDDEHLPIGDGIPTLYKPDLSGFFKRFRQRLDYHFDIKLRFFACGEYGDSFDRPHYHAVIFLDKFISASELRPFIVDSWKDGLVLGVHFLTPKLSEYVAKYSCKQFGVDYESLGIQSPFGLMSLKPAIGACFVDPDTLEGKKNIEFYRKNNLFHTFDSTHTPYGLPRYYRSRIHSRSQLDAWVDELLDRDFLKFSMDSKLGYASQVFEEFRAYEAYEKNFVKKLKHGKFKL